MKPVARYRIVTVDGRRFEVDTVRVVLDSVFGFGVPEPPKAGPVPPPVKVGLSINQISRVEEHRFSVIKTVLVVGGVLAVLIGLAGLDLYLAMEE